MLRIKYPDGVMPNYKRKPINFGSHKFKHRNKYHAHKIKADGHTFDSKVEYDYYLLLKAKGKTFAVHKRYEILPHYEKYGIKCRKRSYCPDFVIYKNRDDLDNDKPCEVIDIKGVKQIPSYDTLRFSLFERTHPGIPVIIVRHSRHGWTREKKTF